MFDIMRFPSKATHATWDMGCVLEAVRLGDDF